MLTSKAHLLTTTLFALFSFYAIFYSLYQCQLKFDDTSEINLLSQDNSTWYQHKVKVVFVIIDGFRFDYLLNYENIDHDKALQINKLNKFNQRYFDNPDKFVVLRALADLPTMTVFRVPCFMTGNVPRLGSVLTAFGAIPASEDSVPRQLYLQGKKSYFSGDPILHEYFPKYIESDFKLGAFNVRDKRADAPSQAYISEKLRENKFDFLAAHFLRLDHAGHHQDLYWKGVVEALDDLDQYLLHVMDSIDDDTMLIFGGDHGQTKQGGHGGSSRQETNTALVAYYRKGFMKNKYKNMDLKKIMRSVNETDNENHQIDLTPTLSMLMGLPVPFSNMGQIFNDLYPAGDYLPPSNEDCPETAFLQQALRDNHLNTLQVWNYFQKYYQRQSLFSRQEFSKVAELFDNAIAQYNAAQTMVSSSQQCDPKFQETAVNAIAQSQELSNQIHDLVNGKTPHEVVVFWQAFLILAFACASYILQIQYIYATNDYEYISWNIFPKDRKAATKTLIPFTILLGLVWAFMLASSSKIMRPITSTVLLLAVYVLGKSILSFLAKQRQESNSSTTTAETEENQGLTFAHKLKKSFLFQSSSVAAAAGALIAFLFYLTHGLGLHLGHAEKLARYDPYVCVMLVACGVYNRYVRSPRKVFATAGAICIVFKLINAYDLFWMKEVNIVMAFIFLGDWLWDEMQFSVQKLKAGVAWSYQYIAGFVVLIFYHLLLNSKSDFTQITVPRVIWFITIGSCVASFALKLSKQTIKRNMQVNLVLFLCLMQMHHKFLAFIVVLSLYRITTYFFKRAQFKNYVYALILGLISYVGLFYIGFSDRNLPRDFGPAFVGLRDFHIALCLLLYGSAMLSTIILAMLFMSFYSQNLELQEVELGVQMDESSDCEAVALKGNSKVIRKRNLLMYCFFYNLIMIGAAIHPIVLTDHKKINLSMERFLAVGTFYLFTINTLFFVF